MCCYSFQSLFFSKNCLITDRLLLICEGGLCKNLAYALGKMQDLCFPLAFILIPFHILILERHISLAVKF